MSQTLTDVVFILEILITVMFFATLILFMFPFSDDDIDWDEEDEDED